MRFCAASTSWFLTLVWNQLASKTIKQRVALGGRYECGGSELSASYFPDYVHGFVEKRFFALFFLYLLPHRRSK
jgi:hypothetical protein